MRSNTDRPSNGGNMAQGPVSVAVHAVGIALAVGLALAFLYAGVLWLAAVLFMAGLGVLVALAMRMSAR